MCCTARPGAGARLRAREPPTFRSTAGCSDQLSHDLVGDPTPARRRQRLPVQWESRSSCPNSMSRRPTADHRRAGTALSRTITCQTARAPRRRDAERPTRHCARVGRRPAPRPKVDDVLYGARPPLRIPASNFTSSCRTSGIDVLPAASGHTSPASASELPACWPMPVCRSRSNRRVMDAVMSSRSMSVDQVQLPTRRDRSRRGFSLQRKIAPPMVDTKRWSRCVVNRQSAERTGRFVNIGTRLPGRPV